MTEAELYQAIVRLCQDYGITTEDTYEAIHQAIATIVTDPEDVYPS